MTVPVDSWMSTVDHEAAMVFVFPILDAVDHEVESVDCVCGPRVGTFSRDDGVVFAEIVHEALDGRE